MIGIRRMIEAQVLGLTGMALKEIDFERPKESRGCLVPSRPSGRCTAILPRCSAAALARCCCRCCILWRWPASGITRFREDILGRLRRTSQFISATTFATTPDAERLIAKVQGIHQRIAGVDKDGTPYQASDPALLTWVHVAECSCFMASTCATSGRWSVPSARRTIFVSRRKSPGGWGLGISLRHRRRWRTISRRCARDCAATNVPGGSRGAALHPSAGADEPAGRPGDDERRN